jgi:exopolyphosphatase/guanosine-5'-triphosphate,3'-diphosphate pyrophosphatase
VSNLSNGDKPTGKGPNPRRRRRRRSADSQQKVTNTFADGVATQRNTPPEVSHEGGNVSSKRGKDGSGYLAGDESAANGSDTSLNAGGITDKSNPPKKRRRYPFRKQKNQRHDSIRNVRSAPQRTPDAAFEPNNLNNAKLDASPAVNFSERQSANPRRAHYANAYAALDLGTNNCRLLIAVPQERGGFRVIDGFSKIVRLGEGLSQTGELSQEAMDRSVEALKICATKLGNRKIKRQRLIATEACRQAKNGELFLKRVKEESGLDLEIVSRETEARLATEGCGSLMDRKSDGAVLFDIGGGSSELILVNNIGARKKKISERIAAWTSLPMGVVTLAERFGGQNVSRKVFDDMVKDVMVHIDAFEGKEALKNVFSHGRVHLLGTSGTVTTLAGIHLELPRYDRKRVDGIWLKDEDVDTVINKLLSMSYEERSRNPCIGSERADLVLAGCAILNAIRLTWPTKRLRVADRGLREGLLAEMMNLDKGSRHSRRSHRNAARRKKDDNKKMHNDTSSQ